MCSRASKRPGWCTFGLPHHCSSFCLLVSHSLWCPQAATARTLSWDVLPQHHACAWTADLPPQESWAPSPHHHLLTMPQSSPKLKAPQRIPQQLWPGARSHSELRQHKTKEESSRHLRDPHKKPASGYRQGAELYINARLLWKRLSPDLCSLLTPSKIFCWRTKERH